MVGNKVTGKRAVLRNFFRPFVQAKVDYHLPFLAASRSLLNGVQVEINKCLRIITGCLQSTSVPALHVEAGVVPQFWRARGLLVKLVCRCLGRGQEDLVGKLLRDYMTLGNGALQVLGIGGLGASLARSPPFGRFHIRTADPRIAPWVWGHGLGEESWSVGASTVWERGDSVLRVYSDASFDGKTWAGGAGVAIPQLKLTYAWRLEAVPSSFTAELVAISLALDVAMDLGVNRFVVLSDSQAAVRFLQSSIRLLEFGHPVALEVGLKLFQARRTGILVSLGWVPGHQGILGNEEADDMARRACFGEVCQVVSVPCSARHLLPVVRAWELECWGGEWAEEQRGRDLFALHPSVSCPRDLDKMTRRDSALLSRLRTGHVGLVPRVFDWHWNLLPSVGVGSHVRRSSTYSWIART